MKDKDRKDLPRERLMQLGADALSDAELLAILLRTGIRGKSVLELAQEILDKFQGNLCGVCDAGVAELREIQGMGMAKSVEICAAFALVKRLAQQAVVNRPEIRSPLSIAKYMRGRFSDEKKEEFHVLLLDSQMCVMRSELVTIGLADRSLVHPREVFRPAIREACSSVIISHNHPSGSVKPSGNDMEVTTVLCKAGEIIGIKVVDHIIVSTRASAMSKPEFFSFLSNDMMPKLKKTQ